MGGMFFNAAAFNQNLSGWCVQQFENEPTNFKTGAAFANDPSFQPDWDEPCNGDPRSQERMAGEDVPLLASAIFLQQTKLESRL